MGKSIAIIAAGIFLVFMGCQGMSGSSTEIEHLYQGETVTLVCVDGRPTDEVGIQLETALQQCRDEQEGQRSTTRLMVIIGVLLVGWGVVELRRAQST